jgi:hypothetical protein
MHVAGSKTKGKRILGRPVRWSEDNIKIDVRESGWGVMDRIHLAHNGDHWWALVNTVINLWVK